jgi:hypothetical protein
VRGFGPRKMSSKSSSRSFSRSCSPSVWIDRSRQSRKVLPRGNERRAVRSRRSSFPRSQLRSVRLSHPLPLVEVLDGSAAPEPFFQRNFARLDLSGRGKSRHVQLSEGRTRTSSAEQTTAQRVFCHDSGKSSSKRLVLMSRYPNTLHCWLRVSLGVWLASFLQIAKARRHLRPLSEDSLGSLCFEFSFWRRLHLISFSPTRSGGILYLPAQSSFLLSAFLIPLFVAK